MTKIIPEVDVTTTVAAQQLDDDRWMVASSGDETYIYCTKNWKDLTTKEKQRRFIGYLARTIALLALLFTFICSLDLLADSFRLIGGKSAGRAFQQSTIIQNPVSGLIIGVLVTVILQSSSTTTSIIVSMVAGGMLDVNTAIPIVMGANIGTSMTNTIVSLGQSGDRDQFRRAFAGATVHDMFNLLNVLVLLPIEILTGMLEKLTETIVEPLSSNSSSRTKANVQLLTVITRPLTRLIVELDSKLIDKIALSTNESDIDKIDSLIRKCIDRNGTVVVDFCKYHHIFSYCTWSDLVIGLILLLVSLALLIGCLISIVRVLSTLLKGRVAGMIRKTVDKQFPGVFRHFTGYFVILIGCGATILVQSSSVFTSALTPLVGLGIVSIERMYPLTLGANLGTTFTGLLAAMATDPSKFKWTLQIALCHLFFNLIGIIIFYVVPFMRLLPIGAAKFLGDKTAKYRWFAVLYLLLMFFCIPTFIFVLSIISTIVMIVVMCSIGCFIMIIVLINVLQLYYPILLPTFLRDWNFLPIYLHSLHPYDKIVVKMVRLVPCCQPYCEQKTQIDDDISISRISINNMCHHIDTKV